MARNLLPSVLAAWIGWACLAAAANDDRIRSVMFLDPKLEWAPPSLHVTDALRATWLGALARPDQELQQLAADSIQLAQRHGLGDWDGAAARLRELLEAPTSSPTVKRAAAAALIAIDARSTAELLLAEAQGTRGDIAQIVEPALAAWNYAPAREVWLQRLRDPDAPRGGVLLAIEGVRVCGERQAAESLLQRAQDPNELITIRLAAARAAAALGHERTAAAAATLAKAEDRIDRILAAALLAGDDRSAAIGTLTALARDSDAAVAAAGLRNLYDIRPELVAPFSSDSIEHRDANIRRIGAESLVHQATPAAVRAVSVLLGDTDPRVRRFVSDAFIELAAQESLRETVVEVSRQSLADRRWQALEQAAVVVGALKAHAAGPALLPLLNHRRPEIQLASAWSLGQLKVPELLPAMLQHLERQVELLRAGGESNVESDAQLSQFLQAFGECGFREAAPLMRRLALKSASQIAAEGRLAAIWSLGHFHADGAEPAADLVRELTARLADSEGLTPEPAELRRMCAVSLGRMRAADALPTLRRFADDADEVGDACYWAIERMTGEPPPPKDRPHRDFSNWFLTPY